MIGRIVSHYRIDEEIGSGAMGVVYRAEDIKLRRNVALKFLSPDLTHNSKAKARFIHEAQAVSRLEHMNICTIYEIDETIDGQVFFAMALYQGGTLKARLNEGRLRTHEAIDRAIQIGEGLAEVHRHDIIHRDIKPANIYLVNGTQVKILDFGVALLAEHTRLTESGMVVGTIPYMSPEQIGGLQVDCRTDIWSLGICLYEMLSGMLPFSAEPAEAMLQNIARYPPTPITDYCSDVPPALHNIIRTALRKRRENRYESASDMIAELRECSTATAPNGQAARGHRIATDSHGSSRRLRNILMPMLVMLAIGLGIWGAVRLIPDHPSDGPTIAVLPFHAWSDEDQFAGSAFSEAVVVCLSRIEDLRVVPIGTSDKPISMSAIGKEQNVHRILSGKLTRLNEAIMVTASLFNTSENRVEWGFNRTIDNNDWPKLVDELTGKMCTHLELSIPDLYKSFEGLTGGPGMSSAPLTYEAIAALRHAEVQRALDLTKELVSQFPDEPDAYVFRMRAFDLACTFAPVDAELCRQFDESIARLAQLDSNSPYVSYYRCKRKSRDLESLVAGISGILERGDLAPRARAWFRNARAVYYTDLGDMASAIADFELALKEDPVNHVFLSNMSRALKRAGRYEESLAKARQAVILAPDAAFCQVQLGVALEALGRLEEAARVWGTVCDLKQEQMICALYSIALLKAGLMDEATNSAERAALMGRTVYGAYNLGCFWALAGHADKAIEYLDWAVDLGYKEEQIFDDEELKSLFGHPSFQAILDRVRERLPAGGAP